jgi:hypothetical protein
MHSFLSPIFLLQQSIMKYFFNSPGLLMQGPLLGSTTSNWRITMKRLLITALISLFTIGSASADFVSDSQYDLLYAPTTSVELNNLPPTAAGRSTKMEEHESHGSMQDHPSERVSGI